jgi:catechol 2,3-dioxygenase-like lactoylglutathione lyase family enzyme
MEQRGRFHVGVVVQELHPMFHFYSEVIGLEYLGDLQIPGILMKVVAVGDAFLKLLVLDEPPARGSPGGWGAGIAGLRYLTITIQVQDVAATVERCAQAGLSVPMPAFEHEPGLAVAVVEDPDGNSVELINKVMEQFTRR